MPRGQPGRRTERLIRRWLVVMGVVATAGGLLGADDSLQVRPLAEALTDERVRRALDLIDDSAVAEGQRLARLAAIEAPSGQERARALAVADDMRAAGLRDVTVDEAPNAVGVIRGASGRAIVFVSTLDDLATVVEHQRRAARAPVVDGDRVVGPGTNTSATTGALLAAARSLAAVGVRPRHDLVFAAVAQEETGLVGMKKLYAAYRDRALAFVDVLGDGSTIAYGAIGIHWWKVVASGPPGHTLGGGLPNVNQGIGRAVDRILQMPHPEQHRDRRTVINVARLESGAVFNHKPATGWFSLDVRSLDAAIIERIEEDVRRILEQVAAETGIAFVMEAVQLTPGGQIPGARDSALVSTSVAIARHLGLAPRLNDAGSSNMNVAIAGATPAIGLGGNRGGDRATPDEWADLPAMLRAAKHVVLLTACLGW